MTREKLTLFDTTLRDGAQMAGVDFSLADKRHIAALLDDLGVDYVEGGYPGANPIDTELFAVSRRLNTTFTAFGFCTSSPAVKGFAAVIIGIFGSAISVFASGFDNPTGIAVPR